MLDPIPQSIRWGTRLFKILNFCYMHSEKVVNTRNSQTPSGARLLSESVCVHAHTFLLEALTSSFLRRGFSCQPHISRSQIQDCSLYSSKGTWASFLYNLVHCLLGSNQTVSWLFHGNSMTAETASLCLGTSATPESVEFIQHL